MVVVASEFSLAQLFHRVSTERPHFTFTPSYGVDCPHFFYEKRKHGAWLFNQSTHTHFNEFVRVSFKQAWLLCYKSYALCL